MKAIICDNCEKVTKGDRPQGVFIIRCSGLAGSDEIVELCPFCVAVANSALEKRSEEIKGKKDAAN
jgi:hypothetical protein